MSSRSWTHIAGISTTAGAVGYLGSNLIYGSSKAIRLGESTYALAMVLGLASAGGMFLSEITHEYIFSYLHVTDRLANPASTGLAIATNFGATSVALTMLDGGDVFAEIDKKKLFVEAAGVVMVSDFLFNRFISPMVLGEDEQ